MTAPGRLVRHRRPTPTAVAVDVRVDLWTGTQSELASVLDAWTRTTATRGQLLLRPAVLAADVAPTDTSVRLLSPAEPAGRTTIALLDVIDTAVVDRLTGRAARLIGGPQVLDGDLTLAGARRTAVTNSLTAADSGGLGARHSYGERVRGDRRLAPLTSGGR